MLLCNQIQDNMKLSGTDTKDNYYVTFVGRFDKGMAFGPCWNFYEGGGYLFGNVDYEEKFSGANIEH